FYPVRRSHVLPKTAEAKTEKLFLVQEHARIGILRGAELPRHVVRLHVVENARFQHLNACEHELCSGNGKVSVDSCLEKSANSSVAVYFHRAVLIGQWIRPQNQCCRGAFFFVEGNQLVER